MCTVIYIPSKDGPLFSSCRDEDPARATALCPVEFFGNSGLMVYPKDAAANGTWAGVHEKGHIIILLNGATVKHERKKKYKKSRGIIVRALLDTAHPLKQWNEIDLQYIEPFTLVVWMQHQLYELLWDGDNKFEKMLAADEPKIWSSSTLYAASVQQQRRFLFYDAIQQNKITTSAELLQFLQQHRDSVNGFVMKRNAKIQTLSISLIQQHSDHFVFCYHDLQKQKVSTILLQQKQHLQMT